jgi:hypothetical protein
MWGDLVGWFFFAKFILQLSKGKSFGRVAECTCPNPKISRVVIP